MIPEKFLAKKGKIMSTPCYFGRSGYNCEKCPLGKYKNNPFVDECIDCSTMSDSGSYKIFKKFNDCEIFDCDHTHVSVDKHLNKYCL